MPTVSIKNAETVVGTGVHRIVEIGNPEKPGQYPRRWFRGVQTGRRTLQILLQYDSDKRVSIIGLEGKDDLPSVRMIGVVIASKAHPQRDETVHTFVGITQKWRAHLRRLVLEDNPYAPPHGFHPEQLT